MNLVEEWDVSSFSYFHTLHNQKLDRNLGTCFSMQKQGEGLVAFYHVDDVRKMYCSLFKTENTCTECIL